MLGESIDGGIECGEVRSVGKRGDRVRRAVCRVSNQSGIFSYQLIREAGEMGNRTFSELQSTLIWRLLVVVVLAITRALQLMISLTSASHTTLYCIDRGRE